MNKTKLPKFIKTAGAVLSKHSPEILTGIGIAGMVTSTILAVKATPKALDLIAEEEERRKIESKTKVYETLPAKDVIKITWKCYIPSALTCLASTACIIGARSVQTRRTAALATAYKISETALTEYREKVIETIGEKKEQTIRDKVAKEKITKDPVANKEIIITEKGNTLCYDSISGRYFKSDIDKIKKAENELNKKMLNEMYLSLNEFYDELGLRPTSLGNELGWNIDDGLIDIHFSSHLSEDDQPCVVLEYHVAPRYGYERLM